MIDTMHCAPMSDAEIAQRDQGEDRRKTGLKTGIRQLSSKQIIRTLEVPEGQMALDHGNFVGGCYCPLAIGVGLDKCEWHTKPTNDSVSAVLHIMGFKVNNTRGIPGNFYRDNRLNDYRTAAKEVLRERGIRVAL